MPTPPFTLPGSDRDLADPAVVADLLRQTAHANRADPARRGCCAYVDAPTRLLMTGDLHDNARGLAQAVKLAKLDKARANRIVLHEIVHGPSRINGMDLSIRTLARACCVKLAYPEQVYMMLSNHELAQRRQEHVFKDGGSDIDAFNDGLSHLYGDEADDVHAAFDEYVDSLLLAVRCGNGVMCAHSLPSPRKIELFDPAVLERELTEADYAADGSAHLMVWGRHQTQKVAAELADAWGAETFLLGHQPADMGWEEMAHNILILASDHDHACALPLDLEEQLDRDELTQYIVPLGAVRV
ncbi:MAG: hypothetical protein ACIAXF_01875 [Phycisphaerales bacterium JB063]